MNRLSTCVLTTLLALLLAGCAGSSGFHTQDTPFYDSSGELGTLLVFGDWGSGTDDEALIASSMQSFAGSHPVQAILTTGDNFYEDDPEQILAPFQWAETSGIDFWLTWGNHDVESGSRIKAINSAFGNPPRWTTIEWGAASILILDSNEVGSREQLSYIESEMLRIDGPTIVVFHHPAFSCADHIDNPEVDAKWLPLLDDDVVLVLSGHSHTYQRFEDEGIPFVVTGGGGRELDDIEACPTDHIPQMVGTEAFHFVTLSQEDQALLVTAVDEDGYQIDHISIPLPT